MSQTNLGIIVKIDLEWGRCPNKSCTSSVCICLAQSRTSYRVILSFVAFDPVAFVLYIQKPKKNNEIKWVAGSTCKLSLNPSRVFISYINNFHNKRRWDPHNDLLSSYRRQYSICGQYISKIFTLTLCLLLCSFIVKMYSPWLDGQTCDMEEKSCAKIW